METGRRGELIAYLVLIALNLLVLPSWFSPGRFAFGARLALIVLSTAIIAFCSWKVSQILGVSPFTKRKHPTYAPYDAFDDDDDRGEGSRGTPRDWGQAGRFREYDPYDEAPDLPDDPTRENPR